MKIHYFIISASVVFLLVVGGLSQTFYMFERQAVLGYLTSGVTQSVFRLEEDIKTVLPSISRNEYSLSFKPTQILGKKITDNNEKIRIYFSF